MINIFNTKTVLKKYPKFPIEEVKNSLEDIFNNKEDINIIFISPEQIMELNKQYRDKDEITDVLSFNIEDKNLLGEVYICPEYILKTTDKENLTKQIIRIMIHGILHLKGYDHKQKFTEVDYKDEPMYIKQEDVLNKILGKEK